MTKLLRKKFHKLDSHDSQLTLGRFFPDWSRAKVDKATKTAADDASDHDFVWQNHDQLIFASFCVFLFLRIYYNRTSIIDHHFITLEILFDFAKPKYICLCTHPGMIYVFVFTGNV